MRVLFDGHWWVDNGPISGRVVVRDLVEAWARTFPQDDVVLAVREGPWRRSPPPCRTTSAVSPPTSSRTPWSPRWSRCACNVATDPSTWCSPRTSRRWWDRGPLHPRRALPDEPRVVHPGGAGVLRRHPRPGPARPGRADVLAARGGPHPAAEPPVPRVAAIGLGVPTGLATAVPDGPAGGCGPRLLRPVVGRLNIRKNLEPSIEGALLSWVPTERPLVVVGEPPGRRSPRRSRGRGGPAGPTVPGRCLGRGAGVALLPSRPVRLRVARRGFRAPPHEALHFGCPVLASDLPVLRETLGTTVTYADPHDPAGIASATSAALRVPAGQSQSRPVAPPEPSWQQVAERARAAVEEALAPAAQASVDAD